MSSLFQRISTCANAIRYLKDNDEKHVSSCEEVMQYLRSDEATEHKNTNVIKASVRYLKLGFADVNTPIRKVNIAMWVAVSTAYDHNDNRFAKEVCARFEGIDDFDRNVMEKILSFSIYNARVGKLLDKAMVEETKGIYPLIEHELSVEFIVLFFSTTESLVSRGHSLVDLGYAGSATSSDMKRAREIMELHVDDIDSRCSPCFKKHVFKQRGRNSLFPIPNGFPKVSVGSRHINFDEATIDTLKESLLNNDAKREFLEMMNAVISHASNEPVVTFRCLQLESVRTFFLEKMLDEVQAKETLELSCVSDETLDLRRDVVSLKEENLALKKELESVKKDVVSREKEVSTLKRKNEVLDEKLPRVRLALKLSEELVNDCLV